MTDREPSKASESIQHSLANRETVAPSGLEDSTPASSGPFTSLPSQFGRYRVTKLLGRGAMGTVYLAHDPDLGKDVALKVPKFSGDEDPVLLERFRREARAAGDLNHENICGVYEVGQIGTTHFIAMEYIDGRPLSDYIAADLPSRKIAILVRRLALALAQAHDRGIVHRDLKPANIMVNLQGEPVIMDFGLARRLDAAADVRATQSGMIVGSPAYMSPEQARGENDKIGPRTDIYGLGTLFFELLTGSLPFRGPMLSVLGQLATQPPPKPSSLRADVDPRLESLCLKMLEKQPQNRPASMTEVAQSLTDWLKGGGSSPEIAVRVDASPIDSVALKPTKPAATPRTEPADGLAAQKQRVTDLLDQHNYGAAIELLEKIVHLRDPRFAPLVAWARPQLAETRATEQNVRESSAPMCGTAGQLLKLHDYAGAVELLTQVPPAYRSAELRDLLDHATDLRDECDHLQRDIEAAVRTGDTETLPALVRRLYKLKPNNKSIKRLAADLKQYGAAKVIARRQGQRRFLDSAGRVVEPQHVALSIVLVVGLFVGVSLLVQNYLANSNPSGPMKSPDPPAQPSPPPIQVAVPGIRLPQEGLNIQTVPPDEPIPVEVASPNDKLSEPFPRMESVVKTAPAKVPSDAPGIPPKQPSDPPPEMRISKYTEMKLVLIPAGTFEMGSSEADIQTCLKAGIGLPHRDSGNDEQPQQTVCISQPFFMGENEVTEAEYKQVMGTLPRILNRRVATRRRKNDPDPDTSMHPVTEVSWYAAIEFCNKLSEKDGLKPCYSIMNVKRPTVGPPYSATVSFVGGSGYRLPTEAEWEYACRGNTKTAFSFGDEVNEDMANLIRSVPGGTTKVRTYPANAFGLYDMHGNVSEWCFDVYDESAYTARKGTTNDPVILTVSPSNRRVLRGGSCSDIAWYARSAARSYYNSGGYAGFRVARDSTVPSTPAR